MTMKQMFSHCLRLFALMTVVISCVPDAELPALKEVSITTSHEKTDDYIKLIANPESDGLEVTDRGFYVKRHVPRSNLTTENDYKIPDEQEDFSITFNDVLGDPANYECYAYATIGHNRFYRSMTDKFQSTFVRPPVIDSVSIGYNSNNVTGVISIFGRHFTTSSDQSLKFEKQEMLLGEKMFYGRKYSTTKIMYSFAYYNIGSFAMTYSSNDSEIVLDKKLEIKGPRLVGFEPERPRIGEWIELFVEDNPTNREIRAIDAEHKRVNGKDYIRFHAVPKSQAINAYYVEERGPGLVSPYIYLQPMDVNFTY